MSTQWRINITKFWTRPPSKFFQFYAVFGTIWQNRMLTPPDGWRPHLGEILDPPLQPYVLWWGAGGGGWAGGEFHVGWVGLGGTCMVDKMMDRHG